MTDDRREMQEGRVKSVEKQTEIPVIFCFDDRILLGAGVSILSMLDAAAPGTTYDIHIFHPGFGPAIRGGVDSLVAGTRHKIDAPLHTWPGTSSGAVSKPAVSGATPNSPPIALPPSRSLVK